MSHVAMLAFALELSRPHSQCNRQAWRAPIGRRAGSPVAATVAAALEELAISRTRQWISDHVIRLGLCPFAARPFQQDRIRYVVSNATTDEELLEDFYLEAARLIETPEEEIATSFVIAPYYSDGIDAFYWLYEFLVDTLEEAGEHTEALPPIEQLVGNRVQPAFFHPQWSFTELEEDAPLHFEKRAPTPVINLLRRAQLDRVVQEGIVRGVVINKEIAEHNAAALEAEGFERLHSCFARWLNNGKMSGIR